MCAPVTKVNNSTAAMPFAAKIPEQYPKSMDTEHIPVGL